MAESDPLRKYLEAGIALTQLTRARAEAIVKELVKAGELQREQAQDRVEELLDRSRKSTDGLLALVRREVAQQLASMGFATKQDLEQLEARLEGRIAASAPEPGRKPPTPPPPKPTPASSKAAPAPSKTAPAPSRAAPASSKTAAPPPGTAARTGATAATKAGATKATSKSTTKATTKATAARRRPAPAVEPD